MEAPEKIYADPEVFNISDEFNDLLQTKEEGRIEYTRTEVFIKKAVKFLKPTVYVMCYGNQQDADEYIEDFKNYMKGE